MALSLRLLCLFSLCLAVTAKVYFQEKFDDDWEKRWVISDWKKSEGSAGEWKHTAGKYHKDPEDKGIQTSPDARFFAISSKIEDFDNKDKDLVFQFQVKHEQDLDCGGGYLKLMEGEVDQKNFGGDTPYSIMFGPDICGYSTKRVHAILTHEGKNMLIKKNVECETDTLSHVYTFILSPNNTYKILIDNEEKSGGDIFAEWDFLKPKTIADKSVKKPADWVDDENMDDPEDKKPDGWDDIPAEIVDPEAQKPEDWSDEDDGEWEAPLIPNPDYKGEWKPKRIKNPAYQGKWKPPMIDNPEYTDKPEAHRLPTLRYVGIEIWQVKAGTIFDNVLVTDDAEYALKYAEETWGAMKADEKTKYDEAEKAQQDEESKEDEDAGGDEDAEDDDESDAEAEAAEEVAEEAEDEEAAKESDHDEL